MGGDPMRQVSQVGETVTRAVELEPSVVPEHGAVLQQASIEQALIETLALLAEQFVVGRVEQCSSHHAEGRWSVRFVGRDGPLKKSVQRIYSKCE